jgi:magnesium chelatase subunit H
VLYALPEVDGDIDTIPLGGLVGDPVKLLPARIDRLTGRFHKWIFLRHQPVQNRRVAILLYGFPPGIGACGTTALLNFPESLSGLLRRRHEKLQRWRRAHAVRR